MKKIFAMIMLCSSLVWGVEMGGGEFSPELGVIGGKSNDYLYGGYARVWLGIANVVIAPQVRYALSEKNDGDKKYSKDNKDVIGNLQYGLLAGYNIKVPIVRLTPYVGVNQSSFSSRYKDTQSYNLGIKLKPAILPLSVGIEYERHRPYYKNVNGRKNLSNVQVFLGLHF